jgi:hypothetical protein
VIDGSNGATDAAIAVDDTVREQVARVVARARAANAWKQAEEYCLVRALDSGEAAAADLVAKLGSRADTAKELAYRLYTLCEPKKRAAEALSYKALVQSWPELVRLAAEGGGLPSSPADAIFSSNSRSVRSAFRTKPQQNVVKVCGNV